MPDKILKQYNIFAKIYSDNFEEQDEVGNSRFYKVLSSVNLKKKKLLDIGCGDGADLVKYEKMGAFPSGIEPSNKFVKIGRTRTPHLSIEVGKGENLPYPDKTFDIVVSKYALQTSRHVPKILVEIARVLKKGGFFVMLTKHPLRQFLEKSKTYKKDVNYFQQKIVDSYIYERKIRLKEPSHTLGEYLSSRVLSQFDLVDFVEDSDFPTSEQINGYMYPTFFVAKFKRR